MYLAKLLVIFVTAIVATHSARIDTGANHNRFKRQDYGKLVETSSKVPGSKKTDIEAVITMRAQCKEIDCKKQSAGAQTSRRNIVDLLAQRMMDRNFDGDITMARKEAEERANAIQRAKVAIMVAKGLGHVVTPNDNGLWEGDIMLTKEQSEAIITRVREEAAGATGAGSDDTAQSRRKRNVYHMEGFASYKWELPIPYKIEDHAPHYVFSPEERQSVKDAINDIESKTCVRFVESTSNSALTLYKGLNDPGLCGSATKGRQNLNEIFLRKCKKDFTGVVIHEIMHALGFGHAHNRIDRDDFIDIRTENIDPRDRTNLEKDDKFMFTTYGTSYDYFSILHYGPTDLSSNKKPAIIAKRKPVQYFQSVMGRRIGGLSSIDAEMIQKAYCKPNCKDLHVWCGWWRHKGYCNEENGFFDLMKTTCRKSCEFC